VAASIESATGLPVLGWIPRDPALVIPERHLGLIPTAEPGPATSEDSGWRAFIQAAADRIERYLDVDGLLKIAQNVPELATPDLSAIIGYDRIADATHPRAALSKEDRPRCESGKWGTIAVARDEAFSFTYQDNLDLLMAAGADVVFFSPLHDQTLPPGAACIVLSGGFPELYAPQLAANDGMRQALRRAHRRRIPIYAECGGLMYLTETIKDLDGQEHAMIGLLPGHSWMTHRLTLGYRLAQAAGDSWLLAAGEQVRGHEFHYSVWEDRPDDVPPAYHLLRPDAHGERQAEGAHLDNLLASYVHLHLWGKPELASRFVSALVDR
jgi:cobyrinic acid a,c-diamide synthase